MLAVCMLSALRDGPPNLSLWSDWIGTHGKIFINGKYDWSIPETIRNAVRIPNEIRDTRWSSPECVLATMAMLETALADECQFEHLALVSDDSIPLRPIPLLRKDHCYIAPMESCNVTVQHEALARAIYVWQLRQMGQNWWVHEFADRDPEAVCPQLAADQMKGLWNGTFRGEGIFNLPYYLSASKKHAPHSQWLILSRKASKVLALNMELVRRMSTDYDRLMSCVQTSTHDHIANPIACFAGPEEVIFGTFMKLFRDDVGPVQNRRVMAENMAADSKAVLHAVAWPSHKAMLKHCRRASGIFRCPFARKIQFRITDLRSIWNLINSAVLDGS